MPSECDRCIEGWRSVSTAYAEHLADEAFPDRTTDEWRIRFDSLMRSVYPCKTCRPDAFYRWADGHWSRDHDAAECIACHDHARSTPTTSRDPEPDPTPPPAPPERKDLA